MHLFESNTGRVVALTDPAAHGLIEVVGLPNEPISLTTCRSIITRMTCSQQVNLQFLHTLGRQVYVYVFGDRIGQIMLSGLTFANDGRRPEQTTHGLVRIMNWYHQHKASRRAEPVTVVLGASERVDGFVTGFSCDVLDPLSSIVQWNLTLASIPET